MKLKSNAEPLSFQHFALVCSGANLTLLGDAKVSEKTKYAMIGMFIFLTSVFASLSGGYALYKGFKSFPLAAFIGILWGAFIFTLDRFIISTMRKKQLVADLPWHQKLAQWGGLALRLVLAALLSIVISTPLELKYFEPEIGTWIKQYLDAEMTRIESQPPQNQSAIDRLENENQGFQQKIFEKEKECKELEDRFLKEVQGTGGSGRRGFDVIAKTVQVQYEKCDTELASIRQDFTSKIDNNKKSIQSLRIEGDEQKEVLKAAKREGIGFLAEYEAMNKLAEESASMRLAKLFISLLILMLECTPVLMKMMAGHTPYDSRLEKEEYLVHLNMQKEISHENLTANTDLYRNERMASLLITVQEQVLKEAMSNVANQGKPEIEKTEQAIRRKVVEDLRTQLEKFAPIVAPKNGTKEVQ